MALSQAAVPHENPINNQTGFVTGAEAPHTKPDIPKKQRRLENRLIVWSAVITCVLTAILAWPESRKLVVAAAEMVVAGHSAKDEPLHTVVDENGNSGEVIVWVCNADHEFVSDASLLVIGIGDEAPRMSSTGRYRLDAGVRTHRVWVLGRNGSFLGWFKCPENGAHIRVYLARV